MLDGMRDTTVLLVCWIPPCHIVQGHIKEWAVFINMGGEWVSGGSLLFLPLT